MFSNKYNPKGCKTLWKMLYLGIPNKEDRKMMYTNRPQHEQEVIAKAYDFEVRAIEECDATRNPWHKEIMSWADGRAVWDAIDEALALKYGE